MKKATFLILLGSFMISSLGAQTFPCDGQFYISQNNGGNTSLEQIYYDGNSVTFQRIGTIPLTINGIGFNPIDKYIYAFERHTKQIVRIKRDGTYEKIGAVPGFQTYQTLAGTFTSDGLYIMHDREVDRIVFYELAPSISKVNSVQLRWAEDAPLEGVYTGVIPDFAVDPNNPNRLLCHEQNTDASGNSDLVRGYLLEINIDPTSGSFGEVSTLEHVPAHVILQLGATFFGNDGLFYGYGSKVEPLQQKNLVGVNPYTGASSHIAQGPESRNTDGCSCPVNLKFTKSIEEIEEFCDSIYVTYRFTLVNSSIDAFHELDFTDQLANNGNFSTSLPSEIWGSSNINLTADRSTLSISNFSIAANDSISFTAEVRYPIQAGDFANQAKINGLSSFLGNEILSDDPSTSEPLDPTIFTIEDPEQGIRNNIDTTICYNEVLQVNDSIYTQSGTYQQILEGAAAEGCDSIIEIDLNIASRPMTSIQKEVCFGEEFNFHGDLIAEPGTYTDTLTSARGCDSMVTLELSVADELNVSATNNYTVDNCTVIEADINPEFDVDRVVWEPADGLSCDDCLSPQINVENDMTYTVRIYNSSGCFAEVPIQVTATGSASKDDILVPNAFSPHNNDEINDYFTLFSSQCIVRIEEFLIYNRWGNLVFEQQNIPPSVPELGWDGSFNSKEAPPAVYVYYFKVVYYDGSATTLYGDVTLVN